MLVLQDRKVFNVFIIEKDIAKKDIEAKFIIKIYKEFMKKDKKILFSPKFGH